LPFVRGEDGCGEEFGEWLNSIQNRANEYKALTLSAQSIRIFGMSSTVFHTIHREARIRAMIAHSQQGFEILNVSGKRMVKVVPRLRLESVVMGDPMNYPNWKVNNIHPHAPTFREIIA
jgi:hypothetical protein